MNILFVCTANISRSFLAEKLFKHEIKKHSLDNISVASSGMLPLSGNPPDPTMVDYLKKQGISGEDHKSQQIDEEKLAWADIVLVMEKNHYQRIELQWPERIEKVDLLGKYITDDQSEDDIIDPYGHSPYHYRLAQTQISLAVGGLIKKLLIERETTSL
jgi:protein-tyrosine phosphatase